jgi:hypothetical protein
MTEQNDFVVTGEAVDQFVDYCRTDFVRHLPCRQWINTVTILESLRAAWHTVHDETPAGNNADLDAIQARCDAATPGPWSVVMLSVDPRRDWGALCQIKPGTEKTWRRTAGEQVRTITHFEDGASKDMSFAAHARTDVPVLLAKVKRLREVLNHALVMLTEESHENDTLRARVKRLENALKIAHALIVRHHDNNVQQSWGVYCPVCHRQDGTEPEMDAIKRSLEE